MTLTSLGFAGALYAVLFVGGIPLIGVALYRLRRSYQRRDTRGATIWLAALVVTWFAPSLGVSAYGLITGAFPAWGYALLGVLIVVSAWRLRAWVGRSAGQSSGEPRKS